MKRRAVLLGGGAVVLAGTGWGLSRSVPEHRPPPPKRPIVIATGGTKGVYYKYAQAFKDAVEPRLGPIRPVPTTGSVENVQMLLRGDATFAIVAADAAAGTEGLRAVARLYDDYIHLVVPAGGPIRQLADLKRRRVSLGPRFSGTSLIAGRILAAIKPPIDPTRDLTPAQLSIDDSVPALQLGRIDAFFWSGGLPTPGVTTLADALPLRLVSIPEDAAGPLRDKYGPSYRVGTIPADTYPHVDKPTVTLAVPNLLLTTTATDAAQVNEVTSALFDHAAQVARADVPEAAQLDPRTAIFTEPIALHDGARRYYRSVKTLI
jgi:TRAP transporter TAXI family solute receptor